MLTEKEGKVLRCLDFQDCSAIEPTTSRILVENGEAMTNRCDEKKNQRNSNSFIFFLLQFKHLEKHAESKVKIDNESYHPELSNKAKLQMKKV